MSALSRPQMIEMQPHKQSKSQAPGRFTSTIALGNATMPFMLALADKGWKQACIDDEHLLNGLNVHAGQLTYYAVGKALGLDVVSPSVAVKQ